jgi:pimeloyl-ACP methyl ester carboxylesterase
MDERFCDVGRGITLCYETFGDPADPPALLVMGLATQMIAWHEDFCERLAARGFYVVRFDNRDTGRSTKLDFDPPGVREMVTRRLPTEQYTLSDMATDAAELVRRLELSPAHIVGASMGGMISQLVAAEHAQHVRSLTSIMSNTGSRRHGQPALGVYRYLLGRPPRTREEVVERAARSFDRGHHPAGSGRQLGAIVASGNRTRKLHRIEAPTLVIHGDRDKMVRPSGGRATARAIPGARLITIEGMGHDLPRPLWDLLIDAIAEHAHAADRAAGERERAAVA